MDGRQTGMATRARTKTEAVTEAGTGTGLEAGKQTRIGREGGEEEIFDIRHIREKSEYKTRHCHSARGSISVDRR